MFCSLHELRVTLDGLTRVQKPELVLAGELQNRLEFSHKMTPLQLLRNVFWLISSVPLNFPGTRLSPPDSEMYRALSGKPGFLGPAPSALRTNVLPTIRAL